MATASEWLLCPAPAERDRLTHEEVALIRREKEREERILTRRRQAAQRNLLIEKCLERLPLGQFGRIILGVLDPVLGNQIDLHVMSRRLGTRRSHVANLR